MTEVEETPESLWNETVQKHSMHATYWLSGISNAFFAFTPEQEKQLELASEEVFAEIEKRSSLIQAILESGEPVNWLAERGQLNVFFTLKKIDLEEKINVDPDEIVRQQAYS